MHFKDYGKEKLKLIFGKRGWAKEIASGEFTDSRMCLFSKYSNFRPMWHMIILSNMSKAMAGQASPNHRPCMPYCSGFKEMALSFLAYEL